MSNTRIFRPGRKAKRLSQKQQIKTLNAQVGYLQGLAMGLAAENEALKMERPADLEDWVDSILDDLSEDERAEWDAMSGEDQQQFLDRLGQNINVSKAVLDAGEEASPSPVSPGS